MGELLAHKIHGTSGQKFGVVYEDGADPDPADPEGWKLSWDYRSRFGRPLRFRLPSGHIVAIQQTPSSCDASVTADDPIDSSVTVWDSALVLAYLLCRKPKTVAEKSVLELGAGTGLLGCVAGGLGAASVVMTDLPGVCARLGETARKNSACFSGRVQAHALAWGDKGAARAIRDRCFGGKCPDVILSTDCVYREGIPDMLVSSMEQLMGPRSVALCAVASHKPEVMREFCDRVASGGRLTLERVGPGELDEYVRCDSILVYRMRLTSGEKGKRKRDKPES